MRGWRGTVVTVAAAVLAVACTPGAERQARESDVEVAPLVIERDPTPTPTSSPTPSPRPSSPPSVTPAPDVAGPSVTPEPTVVTAAPTTRPSPRPTSTPTARRSPSPAPTSSPSPSPTAPTSSPPTPAPTSSPTTSPPPSPTATPLPAEPLGPGPAVMPVRWLGDEHGWTEVSFTTTGPDGRPDPFVVHLFGSDDDTTARREVHCRVDLVAPVDRDLTVDGIVTVWVVVTTGDGARRYESVQHLAVVDVVGRGETRQLAASETVTVDLGLGDREVVCEASYVPA